MMSKLKTIKTDIPPSTSLLVHFSTKSRYAEAYRTLRTNIYFSMMEKDLNLLLVTSPLSSEGKSTTVANLAFTIAQTGKKVLMVDADFRKPVLSSRFGLQSPSGFSNIIADVLGQQVNSGNVSDYGLNDLIKLNFLQQRNCSLNIANGDNEVELLFLKGDLVDVYWKNRPDSQKLASVLVREKLLTNEEAKLALGHQKKSVRRLGTLLVSMGLVEAKDLNKILVIQIMEAFRIAAEMENGTFSVRSLSEDDAQFSSLGNINLSEFSGDIFSSDDSQSFIKKSIDATILETEEKNLFLLPSGSIPPNPSELLGSSRAAYLLKLLRNKFDIVIIDSSPIIPITDALLLSSQVDGVVLVVKAGKTARTLAKDTVQQLQRAKAKILGVVLNQADVTKSSYYKYYQSYYGS